MAEAMDTSDDAAPALTSKQKTRQDQVASLPWVEKYRPKDMADLVSHDDIITAYVCYALYVNFIC